MQVYVPLTTDVSNKDLKILVWRRERLSKVP